MKNIKNLSVQRKRWNHWAEHLLATVISLQWANTGSTIEFCSLRNCEFDKLFYFPQLFNKIPKILLHPLWSVNLNAVIACDCSSKNLVFPSSIWNDWNLQYNNCTCWVWNLVPQLRESTDCVWEQDAEQNIFSKWEKTELNYITRSFISCTLQILLGW